MLFSWERRAPASPLPGAYCSRPCQGSNTVPRQPTTTPTVVEENPSEFYIIDPKAVSKEQLFGRLDAHTLEWEDGVFTDILRRASTHYYSSTSEDDSTTQQEATVDGRDSTHAAPARVWVIFDGDVDLCGRRVQPVLDDNRSLLAFETDRASRRQCGSY